MNLDQLKEKLIVQLDKPIPGIQAQTRMGIKTKYRTAFPNDEQYVVATAVLILLHIEKGKIHFILTQRSTNVEHHRGQVSLPGGVQEKNESLLQTSLRETEEELGIKTADISLIGKLTPLFVAATEFKVHPFIGIYNQLFIPVPAVAEVESVFLVPLMDILDDHYELIEKRVIRGYNVDVPYYYLCKQKVWGATAMILSEFKDILGRAINA